jgi:hypothetical protein
VRWTVLMVVMGPLVVGCGGPQPAPAQFAPAYATEIAAAHTAAVTACTPLDLTACIPTVAAAHAVLDRLRAEIAASPDETRYRGVTVTVQVADRFHQDWVSSGCVSGAPRPTADCAHTAALFVNALPAVSSAAASLG